MVIKGRITESPTSKLPNRNLLGILVLAVEGLTDSGVGVIDIALRLLVLEDGFVNIKISLLLATLGVILVLV